MKTKLKALIVYNNYWSSKNTDYCIQELMDYAYSKDIDIHKASSSKLLLNIDNILSYSFDFVIMRDKMPLVAKLLELNGLKVFNSYEAIRICDDKSEMSITLKNKGINVPKSYISPQTYGRIIGKDYLLDIEKRLGLPIIVKEPQSSLGAGVSKVDTMDQLLSYSKHTQPLLFEEFISIFPAQDVRVFVVGEKVIGAMKRIAPKYDFRSNIELGGTAETFEVNKEISDLAIMTTKALGLDYAGVDIIPVSNPVVLEANANACFRSLDKIANINTASHIIDYIEEKIK